VSLPRGPRSLQGRLLALVLALLLLLWGGAALLAWAQARHELDELLDAHLAQSAALLVAQQLDADDDEMLDAPTLHRYAPRVTFQVWHEGQLVLRSRQAPTAPISNRKDGFESVQIGDERWRVFAARGAERDIQVYVAELQDARGAILRAVLRSMLWPLAIALPLLALAVWWSVRRGLAPLRGMAGTLAARDAPSIEPLAVADDAPSEMRPLLAALNGLFERIGSLRAAERRFTADAAHELRTPIAAIRAQAQAAQGATDDAERRQALAQTLAGCDRAAHLVDQLLTLSRLEAGAQASRGPADLAAVARRVAGLLARDALARHQDLSLEAELPVPVAADEALLGMAVRNLLDNALRYSPEGARVRVQVAAQAGGAVLVVDDSGPGMAPADLARLGERFFRVLGHDASGSGLGFSIVQRIAQATGATVQASRSADLGGLQVTMRWPAPA
jgi:two-component system, OmpR family, sensor histidine kinase QseC